MTRRLCRYLPALYLVLAAHGAPWTAKWIDVPGGSLQEYGVYHFRRSFHLPAVPAHLIVRVSGDNRYELFLNGTRVAWGPAHGDLTHWRYETVDLAPQLHAGDNVLAAVVWNEGPLRAVAQVTNQTAFLLQAEDPAQSTINTSSEWKCVADKAYAPQIWSKDRTGYYALGPNEKLDAKLYPWGWEQPAYDDSKWARAHEITAAAARDARDAPNRWMLVASEIPLEEQKPERLRKIRTAAGIQADDKFLQGHAPIVIPARTSARLLLDQGYLTTAFPELQFQGGKDATIDLQYAEALYTKGKSPNEWVKGNRNEVEGKQMLGPSDTLLADGARHLYRPLFWRTYRYVQLTIRTAGEPLTLEDFRGVFSGYPFERKATLRVSEADKNAEIQRILETGWHTARLCAHETYMDCPYYEQLQYAGDARIQMMVSLYVSGDARLMKNGIGLLDSSRTAEGATYSRAPSNLQQYIPPFSLWWIGMVHDYWMYVDDPAFVKSMLPGVRAVLGFYASHQKKNGSLGKMPWWNFVDWVKEWAEGQPPADAAGDSAAALDLQLVLAYGWAADLERAFGSAALAAEYAKAGETLRSTVAATDWDEASGLFADQPEHRTFSEQTNTLALLAHAVPQDRARSVMERLIASESGAAEPKMAQSSIYFRAYTNAALREAGMGDLYLDRLGPWREMLADGLSTWAEWNGPDSRSDCHAWGASPNFELLRTVVGVESAGAGFKRIRIAPNLGMLQEISAKMPHPKGTVQVSLKRTGEGLTADVTLPAGTDGELLWAGTSTPLHTGTNHIARP